MRKTLGRIYIVSAVFTAVDTPARRSAAHCAVSVGQDAQLTLTIAGGALREGMMGNAAANFDSDHGATNERAPIASPVDRDACTLAHDFASRRQSPFFAAKTCELRRPPQEAEKSGASGLWDVVRTRHVPSTILQRHIDS